MTTSFNENGSPRPTKSYARARLFSGSDLKTEKSENSTRPLPLLTPRQERARRRLESSPSRGAFLSPTRLAVKAQCNEGVTSPRTCLGPECLDSLLKSPVQRFMKNVISITPDRRISSKQNSSATPCKFAPVPANVMSDWLERVHEIVSLRQLPMQDKPAPLLPFLFLGNYKHAKRAKEMGNLEISHVLNCAASSCPSTHDLYPEMKYLQLHAEDSPTYPVLQLMWEDSFRFIEDARQNGGRVFIHCMAGVNRSATIAIAYVMLNSHLPLLQAVRHVFQQRPFILTNQFFHEELIAFAFHNGLLQCPVQRCPSTPSCSCDAQI